MKILAIHNFHRKGSASGDDQVFKSETALLEAHGHKVIRYTVSNDEFDSSSILGKITKTFGMIWSFHNYREVFKIVKSEKPDIVHVHTFFPLLSPSILYAAKRAGAKVVATLQTGEGRTFSKVIKMVRSPKTGAYVFEERMVPNDKVQEALK